MASAQAKFTTVTKESVEQSSGPECDESCSTQSWGCGDMGLAVAVIILIIIWTIVIWGAWSCMGSNNKSKSRDCDNEGFGAGCFGAGLLWLIVLVLFIGAAYKCGWGAVVGFLVFFLIVILIGMWWWCSYC
jgi:hypothetical protein